MIRILRTLGFLALASVALLAATASVASAANGKLTSDGNVFLDGEDIAGMENFFKFPGLEPIECPGSTFEGEAINAGGAIQPPAETVTIKPIYNNANCHYGTLKATAISNGCDYVLHILDTTGTADQYNATADIVCPGANVFEFLMYMAGNNENVMVCRIKVKAQNGLTGVKVSTNTAKDDLVLEGAFSGISAEKSGLCGIEATAKAERRLNVTVSGTNTTKTATGITVTD